MDILSASQSFSALAHDTRLQAFRLLVVHAPDGLPAGQIAKELAVPHNTLSSHLAVLAQAGWISSQRQGRQVIYQANLEQVHATLNFLVKDCCGGHVELCLPNHCDC